MFDIAGFVAEKNALGPNAFILLAELCYADATLTTALGANKDLTFTAVQPLRQRTVRVRYVVGGTNTPLTVSVSGNDVTVNIATDSGGAASSKASDVMAAVQGSILASALVTVMLAPGSAGSAIVSAFAFTALSGDLYFRAARIEGGSVAWEGIAWNAFGMDNPTRSQNAHGQIPTFDLTLSNVGQVVESILEQNVVEGRPGRLLTIHRDHLSDPTAVFEEPFTIVSASAAIDRAVITCASVQFNWLRALIPRKVVTRANYPGVMGSRSRFF